MKSKDLILGAALLSALAPLQAQQPPPATGPQPVMRMMRPPPPAMTGERADLAIELAGGMPVVSIMVNGRGPFRFGVDTGAAGYLRVTPALATALGLAQVGEVRAGDPSGRNPVTLPLYRVDSVTLGGLTYSGVSASALSLAGPRGSNIDGIVGIGFFENLLLTIDYGRLRLAAGRGTLPAANGRDVVDFTLDRGVLITLPLRIGDAVHPVHLDTGNTVRPLALPAEIAAALPTSGETRNIGRARTVSQEIVIQERDLTAPVSVGATRLPVTAVSFPSAASPGAIGSLALAGMAVTIDYPNKRLRIVPSVQ
ncbi:MAG TPA: retropepsin-like aspartic protease [Allosphingosinicella sp.]